MTPETPPPNRRRRNKGASSLTVTHPAAWCDTRHITMRYFVEIVTHETQTVLKRIDAGKSERTADKCEDGVNINLNHEAFYTRIVAEEDKK